MRGFRASRAFSNFKTSHFGNKQDHLQLIQGGANGQQPLKAQEKMPLPDWLKVPVEKPRKSKSMASGSRKAASSHKKASSKVKRTRSAA